MSSASTIAGLLLAMAASLAAGPALAQREVFRCVDAAGKVTYQIQVCGEGRQDAVKLHVTPGQAAPSGPTTPRKAYKAPTEAVLVFTYDPREEPVGFTTERMEAAIRSAMGAWMAGCQVRLTYAGRAPAKLPGTAERVPIRWEPKYLRSNVAGTGGLAHGIALNVWFREEDMLRVLTHEIGHVLGLPHNHDNPESIMSYLQHEKARQAGRVSEADFLACNQAMRARFGNEEPEAPQAAAPSQPGSRMSDREAVEKMRERYRAANAPADNSRWRPASP
ncbi:DUF4124 domain-containing protein [Caenimonas sedimenti]|uniref:DUF4124 domain-containing protein n=1 Tax=Caenimonas sedimenti TaxID=2596921 RepID=A0A562ZV36_9BURK|nr:matrixin family metalloprotease [Caenimonas sedimenti]TWO72247.1 DUF4124 domain-containing protein [Caenimonas sedimenti]